VLLFDLSSQKDAPMPVVRLSDKTWERLQSHAVPLTDTPERVISRALDALDEVGTRPKRKIAVPTIRTDRTLMTKTTESAQESRLPQKEFRIPIVESLDELGGRAMTRQVIKSVTSKLKTRLSDDDYQSHSSGGMKYENTLQWERNAMKNEGILKRNSPRGMWELSEKGLDYARSLRKKS
jgi:hypothetical protein